MQNPSEKRVTLAEFNAVKDFCQPLIAKGATDHRSLEAALRAYINDVFAQWDALPSAPKSEEMFQALSPASPKDAAKSLKAIVKQLSEDAA